MPDPLENLSDPGKPLRVPDANEFADLLRSGLARLTDALNTTLARKSRFELADNMAHSFSLTALRPLGYRSGNSCTVPHALSLGLEVRPMQDKCHNTRNLREYEGLVELNKRLVTDLIKAPQAVLDALQAKIV